MKWIIFLFFFSTQPVLALNLVRTALDGALNNSHLSEGGSAAASSHGREALGADITAEWASKLLHFTDLELGLGYQPKKFVQNSLEYSTSAIRIPALFRMHTSKKFSLALGPYFAHAFGDLRVRPATSGATTPQGPYMTYQAFGLKKNELGLVGSGQLMIVKKPGIFVDGSFAMGLNNLSTIPGTTRRYISYTVSLGANFYTEQAGSLGF